VKSCSVFFFNFILLYYANIALNVIIYFNLCALAYSQSQEISQH
jgi:hypothetical protein